jgi:hypothetical protein
VTTTRILIGALIFAAVLLLPVNSFAMPTGSGVSYRDASRLGQAPGPAASSGPGVVAYWGALSHNVTPGSSFTFTIASVPVGVNDLIAWIAWQDGGSYGWSGGRTFGNITWQFSAPVSAWTSGDLWTNGSYNSSDLTPESSYYVQSYPYSANGSSSYNITAKNIASPNPVYRNGHWGPYGAVGDAESVAVWVVAVSGVISNGVGHQRCVWAANGTFSGYLQNYWIPSYAMASGCWQSTADPYIGVSFTYLERLYNQPTFGDSSCPSCTTETVNNYTGPGTFGVQERPVTSSLPYIWDGICGQTCSTISDSAVDFDNFNPTIYDSSNGIYYRSQAGMFPFIDSALGYNSWTFADLSVSIAVEL